MITMNFIILFISSSGKSSKINRDDVLHEQKIKSA